MRNLACDHLSVKKPCLAFPDSILAKARGAARKARSFSLLGIAPCPRGDLLDPVNWLLIQADPMLIAPYRWLQDPTAAWWLGTLILSWWAWGLGQATLALLKWVIREYLAQSNQELERQRDLSLAAARAGDKPAFKVLNRQANQAYGKSFFLGLAMGASSLWPAFMALAWLRLRFSLVEVPLPITEYHLNYVGGFIICYVALRVFLGWIIAKLSRKTV